MNINFEFRIYFDYYNSYKNWSNSLYCAYNMHFLNILNVFVSTASAIEIWFHLNQRYCWGHAIVCRKASPNVTASYTIDTHSLILFIQRCCYDSGGNSRSLSFEKIPSTWNLHVRGYYGGKCSKLQVQGISNHDTRVCLSSSTYTGGQYSFVNGKREIAEAKEDCTPPDVLVLEDGTEYTLNGLNNTQVDKLVGLVLNNSTITDIDEGYKALEFV